MDAGQCTARFSQHGCWAVEASKFGQNLKRIGLKFFHKYYVQNDGFGLMGKSNLGTEDREEWFSLAWAEAISINTPVSARDGFFQTHLLLFSPHALITTVDLICWFIGDCDNRGRTIEESEPICFIKTGALRAVRPFHCREKLREWLLTLFSW